MKWAVIILKKKYVENTVPVLADVIYTTLFGTTVEEESGSLTIGTLTVNTNGTTVDEVLEENNPYTQKTSGFGWFAIGIIAVFGIGIWLWQKGKNRNKFRL